jgi:hypothetical protein
VGPWPGEDFSDLADGFYDVTVTRLSDPPGVVGLSLRRWVSCTERPDECPPDFPADGVFADQSTEVDTHLALTDDLTVVIQPLQTWHDGGFPNPPQVITGSGTAFYQLLSGWCGGYLPERNPENCGLDHAFLDWIWHPYQAGDSIDQIIAAIESSYTSTPFPFTEFDDGATDIPCGNDRHCATAYRGPQGTHLIVDLTLLDMGENWPVRLYGWWTSLEIRDGRPVLFIDAEGLAG